MVLVNKKKQKKKLYIMGLFSKNFSIVLVTIIIVGFNIYLSLNIYEFFFLDETDSFRVFKLLRKILLLLTLSTINFYLLDRVLKFFFFTNKKSHNV